MLLRNVGCLEEVQGNAKLKSDIITPLTLMVPLMDLDQQNV